MKVIQSNIWHKVLNFVFFLASLVYHAKSVLIHYQHTCPLVTGRNTQAEKRTKKKERNLILISVLPCLRFVKELPESSWHNRTKAYQNGQKQEFFGLQVTSGNSEAAFQMWGAENTDYYSLLLSILLDRLFVFFCRTRTNMILLKVLKILYKTFGARGMILIISYGRVQGVPERL